MSNQDTERAALVNAIIGRHFQGDPAGAIICQDAVNECLRATAPEVAQTERPTNEEISAVADDLRSLASVLASPAPRQAPAAPSADEAKWRAYEQEYILPCFAIADEIGFDLKAAVAEAKGNCVMRLIQELRRRLAPQDDSKAPAAVLVALKPAAPAALGMQSAEVQRWYLLGFEHCKELAVAALSASPTPAHEAASQGEQS